MLPLLYVASSIRTIALFYVRLFKRQVWLITENKLVFRFGYTGSTNNQCAKNSAVINKMWSGEQFISRSIINVDKASIHSVINEKTLCMNYMKSDIPVRVSGHSRSHKHVRSFHSLMTINMPKDKNYELEYFTRKCDDRSGYRAVADTIIQVTSYGRKQNFNREGQRQNCRVWITGREAVGSI
jgi:hypothetical protein